MIKISICKRFLGRCSGIFICLLLLYVLSAGSGCKLPIETVLGDSGLSPIYIARDSFLIGWEAEKPLIDELPSSISHFNIYYRKLFEKKWIFLKSTCGFRLSATISVADLGGYDSYEFGVAEVLNNGKIMEIHSSSDSSAKPAGGWYLVISPP